MKIESPQFFNQDIFNLTLENTFYRKEVITASHSQIVIMCIPAGQEIGLEAHKVDQILIFVQGHGQAIINDIVSDVHPHHLVFVPAGTNHNFKNNGSGDLKLFTIYAPAEDAPGTLEKHKTE